MRGYHLRKRNNGRCSDVMEPEDFVALPGGRRRSSSTYCCVMRCFPSAWHTCSWHTCSASSSFSPRYFWVAPLEIQLTSLHHMSWLEHLAALYAPVGFVSSAEGFVFCRSCVLWRTRVPVVVLVCVLAEELYTSVTPLIYCGRCG